MKQHVDIANARAGTERTLTMLGVNKFFLDAQCGSTSAATPFHWRQFSSDDPEAVTKTANVNTALKCSHGLGDAHQCLSTCLVGRLLAFNVLVVYLGDLAHYYSPAQLWTFLSQWTQAVEDYNRANPGRPVPLTLEFLSLETECPPEDTYYCLDDLRQYCARIWYCTPFVRDSGKVVFGCAGDDARSYQSPVENVKWRQNGAIMFSWTTMAYLILMSLFNGATWFLNPWGLSRTCVTQVKRTVNGRVENVPGYNVWRYDFYNGKTSVARPSPPSVPHGAVYLVETEGHQQFKFVPIESQFTTAKALAANPAKAKTYINVADGLSSATGGGVCFLGAKDTDTLNTVQAASIQSVVVRNAPPSGLKEYLLAIGRVFSLDSEVGWWNAVETRGVQSWLSLTIYRGLWKTVKVVLFAFILLAFSIWLGVYLQPITRSVETTATHVFGPTPPWPAGLNQYKNLTLRQTCEWKYPNSVDWCLRGHLNDPSPLGFDVVARFLHTPLFSYMVILAPAMEELLKYTCEHFNFPYVGFLFGVIEYSNKVASVPELQRFETATIAFPAILLHTGLGMVHHSVPNLFLRLAIHTTWNTLAMTYTVYSSSSQIATWNHIASSLGFPAPLEPLPTCGMFGLERPGARKICVDNAFQIRMEANRDDQIVSLLLTGMPRPKPVVKNARVTPSVDQAAVFSELFTLLGKTAPVVKGKQLYWDYLRSVQNITGNDFFVHYGDVLWNTTLGVFSSLEALEERFGNDPEYWTSFWSQWIPTLPDVEIPPIRKVEYEPIKNILPISYESNQAVSESSPGVSFVSEEQFRYVSIPQYYRWTEVEEYTKTLTLHGDKMEEVAAGRIDFPTLYRRVRIKISEVLVQEQREMTFGFSHPPRSVNCVFLFGNITCQPYGANITADGGWTFEKLSRFWDFLDEYAKNNFSLPPTPKKKSTAMVVFTGELLSRTAQCPLQLPPTPEKKSTAIVVYTGELLSRTAQCPVQLPPTPERKSTAMVVYTGEWLSRTAQCPLQLPAPPQLFQLTSTPRKLQPPAQPVCVPCFCQETCPRINQYRCVAHKSLIAISRPLDKCAVQSVWNNRTCNIEFVAPPKTSWQISQVWRVVTTQAALWRTNLQHAFLTSHPTHLTSQRVEVESIPLESDGENDTLDVTQQVEAVIASQLRVAGAILAQQVHAFTMSSPAPPGRELSYQLHTWLKTIEHASAYVLFSLYLLFKTVLVSILVLVILTIGAWFSMKTKFWWLAFKKSSIYNFEHWILDGILSCDLLSFCESVSSQLSYDYDFDEDEFIKPPLVKHIPVVQKKFSNREYYEERKELGLDKFMERSEQAVAQIPEVGEDERTPATVAPQALPEDADLGLDILFQPILDQAPKSSPSLPSAAIVNPPDLNSTSSFPCLQNSNSTVAMPKPVPVSVETNVLLDPQSYAGKLLATADGNLTFPAPLLPPVQEPMRQPGKQLRFKVCADCKVAILIGPENLKQDILLDSKLEWTQDQVKAYAGSTSPIVDTRPKVLKMDSETFRLVDVPGKHFCTPPEESEEPIAPPLNLDEVLQKSPFKFVDVTFLPSPTGYRRFVEELEATSGTPGPIGKLAADDLKLLQRRNVEDGITAKVTMVGGPAGSGKTSLVHKELRNLVMFTAPSAEMVSSCIKAGRIALTHQKVCHYRGEQRVLCIDEFWLMPVERLALMATQYSHLILCGDAKQLKSREEEGTIFHLPSEVPVLRQQSFLRFAGWFAQRINNIFYNINATYLDTINTTVLITRVRTFKDFLSESENSIMFPTSFKRVVMQKQYANEKLNVHTHRTMQGVDAEEIHLYADSDFSPSPHTLVALTRHKKRLIIFVTPKARGWDQWEGSSAPQPSRVKKQKPKSSEPSPSTPPVLPVAASVPPAEIKAEPVTNAWQKLLDYEQGIPRFLSKKSRSPSALHNQIALAKYNELSALLAEAMTNRPKVGRVIDFSADTGRLTQALRTHFPEADVIPVNERGATKKYQYPDEFETVISSIPPVENGIDLWVFDTTYTDYSMRDTGDMTADRYNEILPFAVKRGAVVCFKAMDSCERYIGGECRVDPLRVVIKDSVWTNDLRPFVAAQNFWEHYLLFEPNVDTRVCEISELCAPVSNTVTEANRIFKFDFSSQIERLLALTPKEDREHWGGEFWYDQNSTDFYFVKSHFPVGFFLTNSERARVLGVPVNMDRPITVIATAHNHGDHGHELSEPDLAYMDTVWGGAKLHYVVSRRTTYVHWKSEGQWLCEKADVFSRSRFACPIHNMMVLERSYDLARSGAIYAGHFAHPELGKPVAYSNSIAMIAKRPHFPTLGLELADLPSTGSSTGPIKGKLLPRPEEVNGLPEPIGWAYNEWNALTSTVCRQIQFPFAPLFAINWWVGQFTLIDEFFGDMPVVEEPTEPEEYFKKFDSNTTRKYQRGFRMIEWEAGETRPISYKIFTKWDEWLITSWLGKGGRAVSNPPVWYRAHLGPWMDAMNNHFKAHFGLHHPHITYTSGLTAEEIGTLLGSSDYWYCSDYSGFDASQGWWMTAFQMAALCRCFVCVKPQSLIRLMMPNRIRNRTFRWNTNGQMKSGLPQTSLANTILNAFLVWLVCRMLSINDWRLLVSGDDGALTMSVEDFQRFIPVHTRLVTLLGLKVEGHLESVYTVSYNSSLLYPTDHGWVLGPQIIRGSKRFAKTTVCPLNDEEYIKQWLKAERLNLNHVPLLKEWCDWLEARFGQSEMVGSWLTRRLKNRVNCAQLHTLDSEKWAEVCAWRYGVSQIDWKTLLTLHEEFSGMGMLTGEVDEFSAIP